MMKVAIIPARAGSKRLPGKNVKLLGDKLLPFWTIDYALKAKIFDEIIFTTDLTYLLALCNDKYDNKIKRIRRPDHLCEDDITQDKVILHALFEYPLDTVVFLLQPTTPFRNEIDLIMADAFWDIHQPIPIVSAYWEGGISAKIRINGGIYVSDLDSIINGKGFIRQITINYFMPYERSIDIDTQEDWDEAERMLKEGLIK